MEDSELEREWQEKVDKKFPHGVRVNPDPGGDGLEYAMTKPDIRANEGTVYGRGWAYPNKDMFFEFEKIEESELGWTITANGRKYIFKTLSEKDGSSLDELLLDA